MCVFFVFLFLFLFFFCLFLFCFVFCFVFVCLFVCFLTGVSLTIYYKMFMLFFDKGVDNFDMEHKTC